MNSLHNQVFDHLPKKPKEPFPFKKHSVRTRKDKVYNPFALKFVRDSNCPKLKLSEFTERYTEFNDFLNGVKKKYPLNEDDDFNVDDLKVPTITDQVKNQIETVKKTLVNVTYDRNSVRDCAHKVEITKISELEECFAPAIEKIKNGISDPKSMFNFKHFKSLDMKRNRMTKHMIYKKMGEKLNLKGDKRVPETEAILRISIYNKNKSFPYMRAKFLGSSALSSLKDLIKCFNYSDKVDSKDLVFSSPAVASVEIENNGFFFIENTFYNTKKSVSGSDYSQVIIDWNRTKKRESDVLIGPYNQMSVEGVAFKDIDLKVDAVYLYRHKGTCDHFFTVDTISIINSDEAPYVACYPILDYWRTKTYTFCEVCDRCIASYSTYGNEFASHEPFYFCSQCFLMLHFEENGDALYGEMEIYHCNIDE